MSKYKWNKKKSPLYFKWASVLVCNCFFIKVSYFMLKNVSKYLISKLSKTFNNKIGCTSNNLNSKIYKRRNANEITNYSFINFTKHHSEC